MKTLKGADMKSERIHIRIKPEDKAKLQAVADKKRRTITSLIEEMIENLLEEEMKDKLTFVGRLKKGHFERATELITVEGDSFQEIFKSLLDKVEESAKEKLLESEALVKSYYGKELEDWQYMSVVNEAIAPAMDYHDKETRYGNWRTEKEGKLHYLRRIDTQTGEMTFWTEK